MPLRARFCPRVAMLAASEVPLVAMHIKAGQTLWQPRCRQPIAPVVVSFLADDEACKLRYSAQAPTRSSSNTQNGLLSFRTAMGFPDLSGYSFPGYRLLLTVAPCNPVPSRYSTEHGPHAHPQGHSGPPPPRRFIRLEDRPADLPQRYAVLGPPASKT